MIHIGYVVLVLIILAPFCFLLGFGVGVCIGEHHGLERPPVPRARGGQVLYVDFQGVQPHDGGSGGSP